MISLGATFGEVGGGPGMESGSSLSVEAQRRKYTSVNNYSTVHI